MTVSERVQIVVSSSGTVTVKKDIDAIGKSADATARSVDTLKTALTAWISGAAIGQITKYADAFTNIQNRLKIVTNGSDELASATDRLYNISQNTYQSFESTAEVYSRVAMATKQLGISSEQAFQFTEQLNKAVAMSGVSAETAKQGLTQLAQGLASGKLQGDELRSVLEALPYVANTLAQGLGVTTNALREMAAQGQLTPKMILDSFHKMTAGINADFSQLTPTISMGLQTIENGFVRLFGIVNQSTGIFGLAGQALTLIGTNMEYVALAATPLIIALTALAVEVVGGYLVTALAGGTQALLTFAKALLTLSGGAIALVIEGITMLTSAVTVLWGLMLANPVTALIAVFAALGVAILSLTGYFDSVYQYVLDWIEKLLSALGELGDKIKAWFGQLSGGNINVKVQAEQLQKAAASMTNGIKDSMKSGGTDAGNKIKAAMSDGGAEAASKLNQSFANGAEKQTNVNDVMVAKFAGTGRNIYDLWNNWGDAFIGDFSTTLGQLLAEFQRAQTRLINAQANLYNAQANDLALRDSLLKRWSTGTVNPERISSLGFATGGQFTVGGSGGTDTTPVNFMATPGERVTVETPAQQRANDSKAAARTPVAGPTIINQVDPRQSLDVMRTAAGGKVIYNTVAADPQRFRRLLGLG